MKIAFDASEIEFDVAGSGVYARCLPPSLSALPKPPRIEIVSIADYVPAWLPRPFKVLFADLVWTPWLLARCAQRRGADLLHCPSYKTPPRCRLPVVATCHDVSLIDGSPPPSFGLWSRLQGRWHLARLHSRANVVLTGSSFSRARIVDRLRFPGDRVHVAPLGARAIFSAPAKPAARRRVRESHKLSAPYILYVGTIEERKNLDRLVRAFARLTRRKQIPHLLVLAGRDGRGAAATRRLAGRIGLRDRVRFVGHIPEEELPALYAEASLFVYPSLYEGFGLPPLEAMSQGTPVVVARRASLPEVAGDAALLVDPLDEEEIVSVMYRGLTDEQIRRALIARGLARSRQFGWESTAARTLHAYRYALEVAPLT